MKNTQLRAITTRYKGFAFRSRMEARWGVFFDHLGIKWDYEPEGFELGNGLRYLPDFWLPEWKMWVEVKPDVPDYPTIEKASRLAEKGRYPVFVTNGLPLQGGTFFANPVDGIAITGPCEVDWGAKDGNFVWIFTDEMPANSSRYCWGGVEVFVTPTMKQGTLVANAADALDAARSARFEFGQQGAAA